MVQTAGREQLGAFAPEFAHYNDAFLFYRLRRQDLQGKKILTVNEKYYMADHGIREAVFGGSLKDINLVFENIVFIELLRRGYKVTVGKVGEKEIDFIR